MKIELKLRIFVIFLLALAIYSTNVEAITCSLIIPDRSIGEGEDIYIQIDCDDASSTVNIDPHLDSGGSCDFVDGLPTACVSVFDEWFCDYLPQIPMPQIFHDDSFSPCFLDFNEAYRPRNICIKAFIDLASGTDFWDFGDCTVGSGTDYFTYEQPLLVKDDTTVEVGVPFNIGVYAAMFDGIDRIEIDTDCHLSGGVCIDSFFDADITIDSFSLPDDYEVENYQISTTFNSIPPGAQRGVSIKVYDNSFNTRFDSGITFLVVNPPVSCSSVGGICCSSGDTCSGNWQTGTTCDPLCCIGSCITPLQTCSQLGGNICASGQSCEGGNFVDSSDGGSGASALCCVGGFCSNDPPSDCSQYTDNICCPFSQVCQGEGGEYRPNLEGCSAGTACFTGCASQACVTEISACSNSNPTLPICNSGSDGDLACGSSNTLCICNNGQWEGQQFCDEACVPGGGSSSAQGGGSNSSNGSQSQSSQGSSFAYCALRQILSDACEDQDSGNNDLRVKSSCISNFNGQKDDVCAGSTSVTEYHCSLYGNCVADTMNCPQDTVCVDGRCVGDVCPEIANGQIGPNTALTCLTHFDRKNNEIDFSQSMLVSDMIQICEPDPPMFDYVKNLLYTDDSVGKDLLDGYYDAAMDRLWDDIQAKFQSCPTQNCKTLNDKCAGLALKPSELLTNPACSYCFEWSNLLFSAARTAGVPTGRIFMANYQVNPEPSGAAVVKGVILPTHTVVFYLNDDLVTWEVLDVTYAKAKFLAVNWNSQVSECDGCRIDFNSDVTGIKKWDNPNEFGAACANSPFCPERCDDMTVRGQCSATKPFFCKTVEGLRDHNPAGADDILGTADDCGCPNIPNVYQAQYTFQGQTDSLCICDQLNTCLPSPDNVPYFCGAKSIGNANLGSGSVPVSLVDVNCNGPDNIPGTADDCGCPTGYICGIGGWCTLQI